MSTEEKLRNTPECPCFRLSGILAPDDDLSDIDHICPLTMAHSVRNWAAPQIERIRKQEQINAIDRLLGTERRIPKTSDSSVVTTVYEDSYETIRPSRHILSLPDGRMVVTPVGGCWPLRLLDTISLRNHDPFTGRGIVLVLRQYARELAGDRKGRLARTGVLTGEQAIAHYRQEWQEVADLLGIKVPEGTTSPHIAHATNPIRRGLPPGPSYYDYMEGRTPEGGSTIVTSLVEVSLDPDPDTNTNAATGFILIDVQYYLPFTEALSQREAVKTVTHHKDFLAKVGPKAQFGPESELSINLWSVEGKPGRPKEQKAIKAEEKVRSGLNPDQIQSELMAAEMRSRMRENKERKAFGLPPISLNGATISATTKKRIQRAKKVSRS